MATIQGFALWLATVAVYVLGAALLILLATWCAEQAFKYAAGVFGIHREIVRWIVVTGGGKKKWRLDESEVGRQWSDT
jgi:hypothetical protein